MQSRRPRRGRGRRGPQAASARARPGAARRGSDRALTVRAYLGLGSNLGDRRAHLQGALDGLRRTPGVSVATVSAVYETDPVGGPEQGPYLNAVVAIDTELDAWALLAVAQRLEAVAQRVRAERWGPRTLDVDVLLHGDCTITCERLTVPHPRLWDRPFVLVPLRDVAPEMVAPSRLRDVTGVRRTDVVLG